MQRKVSQYDVARERAQQRENAALQQNKDAIARRAAQMGGGPSGAMIKLEQQAADESTQRLAQENRAIDAAEAEQQFLREERAADRGVSIRGQDIQKDLGLKGIETQRYGIDTSAGLTREGQALQKYGIDTSAEMQKYGIDTNADLTREGQALQKYGIDTSAGMQKYGIDTNATLTREGQALQDSQFGRQLDQAWKQFEQSLGQQKWVDEKNYEVALKVLEEKGVLEKIFNPDLFTGGQFTGGTSPGGSPGGGLATPMGGIAKLLGL